MNNVLKLTEADLASVKNGTPILVDVGDDVLHDLTFQEVKDALIEVFECDGRTLKIDEDETGGESYSLLISFTDETDGLLLGSATFTKTYFTTTFYRSQIAIELIKMY